MLKDLVDALRKFNNHAGHNCKLVINEKEEIFLYQTYGEFDCKKWDYAYGYFVSIEDCIRYLNDN